MHLPPEFLTSYQEQEQYPCNLIESNPSAAILRLCQSRLNDTTSPLCNEAIPDQFEVNFRDFFAGSFACQKQMVQTEERLEKWLHQHDQSAPPGASNLITKSDPSCRFAFFTAPHGRASLSLSQNMLTRVLTYHQVPAEYVNVLMTLFKQREESSDLKFRSFWHHLSFGDPSSGTEIHDLGRSGRHYEMCFNLKGAEEKPLEDPDIHRVQRWTVRHAAIYHKFDVITGKAVWVVTQAGRGLRDHLKDATNNTDRKEAITFDNPTVAYHSSLEAHLVLAQWASESWWMYLQDIESALEEKTRNALLVKSAPASMNKPPTEVFTREHLQDVLYYEEKCKLVASVLEGNISILGSIKTHYESLPTNASFTLSNSVMGQTQSFSNDLQSVAHEMSAMMKRAQDLAAHARSRKNLIVQLLQAQTSDNMASMTRRSVRDAMAMRIVTVVTVLYLPATFVSTFFSTDVVKYQPGGDGTDTYHTQYSSLAMQRWFEVTVPLTVVTLTAALIAYVWARRPLRKAEVTAQSTV